MLRKSAIERAFELADSGRFAIPSAIRRAMISEGYTQSDVFTLEGRATWTQLRRRCLAAGKPVARSGSASAEDSSNPGRGAAASRT